MMYDSYADDSIKDTISKWKWQTITYKNGVAPVTTYVTQAHASVTTNLEMRIYWIVRTRQLHPKTNVYSLRFKSSLQNKSILQMLGITDAHIIMYIK